MRAVLVALALLVAMAGCAARAPIARATAKQDEGARTALTYRRLSEAVPTDCALAPWIGGVRGSCTRVAPLAVRSSSGLDAAPAVDEDVCSAFLSGAYGPHELVLELPEATPISALLYVAEQTPDGVTSQVVEISDDGASWTELDTLRGHTITGHVYGAAPRRARAARFVRLRTIESPSWIAFREVTVLSCERRARLTGTAVPRASPVDHSGDRWRRGSGDCVRSRDCAYDDCCSPRTCVADAEAPRCAGVGCPRILPTELVTCACRSGHCGAWISPGPGSPLGSGGGTDELFSTP